MSVKASIGQGTGPAANSNVVIETGSLRSKLLMILSSGQTTNGAAASVNFSLGWAALASLNYSASYNSQDAVATTATVRSVDNASIINNRILASTSGLLKTNTNSIDVGEFTGHWSSTSGSQALFNYLALGGSDIQKVYAGQFNTITTTGSQAIKGVGFKPDIVLFTITINVTNTTSKNTTQFGFGCMDGAGNQWSISQRARDSLVTSDTNRSFSNAACMNFTQTAADNFSQKTTFTSMDSDGFTINHGTSAGLACVVNYVAIKGGLWKVGVDTQNTTTGNKSTTGVGFPPVFGMFGTVCDTATDAIATSARFCMGMSTGSGANNAIWTGDTDNISPTVCNSISSASSCLIMATEGASATPTTQAAANINSFDSDGFTLNWTTADATAREFGYIMLGQTSTAEQGYIRPNTIRPHPFSPGLAR